MLKADLVIPGGSKWADQTFKSEGARATSQNLGFRV